jgi:hypothetical protein
MRVLGLAGLVVCVGCVGESYSPTQVEPVSVNQVFMVGEMKRIERLMDMGEFVAMFGKPPHPSYAGWAMCAPGGQRPPYIVSFNERYIEDTDPSKTPYLSALVAHEMCHYWVEAHKTEVHSSTGCWDEVAAEMCAARYAR